MALPRLPSHTCWPSLCIVLEYLVVSALATRSQPYGLHGSNFGVPGQNATYDYVVIGGGNAGVTIAARLAEGPLNTVAIVEAGSFYEITNGNLSQIPADVVYFIGKSPKDVNPLVDWGFVTTPQPGANGQAYHYARGKTLGGCSARNFMVYQRGTRGSYQMWADEVGGKSLCRLTPHPVVDLVCRSKLYFRQSLATFRKILELHTAEPERWLPRSQCYARVR